MTSANQRWRDGRTSYRPPEEPICTAEYGVAAIADDLAPKRFVIAHHYSRAYPAARRRFGLYRHGELAGVAVFSHPVTAAVFKGTFPGIAVGDCLELGRFVLLDEVPGNGETWFLGQCFRELRREGFYGVLSFSDPLPRRRLDGTIVMPGHVGTIYQAFNGVYRQRSRPRYEMLLPDGTSFSERALQKILSRDQGWRYAAETLVRAGADRPGDDLVSWARLWVARLCRRIRHPGKHRYAWVLPRRAPRLVSLGAYPKNVDPV